MDYYRNPLDGLKKQMADIDLRLEELKKKMADIETRLDAILSGQKKAKMKKPLLIDVANYLIEQGYSVERSNALAEKFYNHYEESKRQDGTWMAGEKKNRPMGNWKLIWKNVWADNNPKEEYHGTHRGNIETNRSQTSVGVRNQNSADFIPVPNGHGNKP